MCDPSEVLKKAVMGCTITINPVEKRKIENLTKKDIVFLTNEKHTRGFNFRIDPNHHALGIALLICKAMSSKRALKQCMGRVGRCGEDAFRFAIRGIELVDRQQEIAMFANMERKT